MFALPQDLPQRSHITWNLSVTTHLSRRFFVLDDIYLLSFLFDDFSFNISSVSDPFIFRLTWRRDLFLVENAYVLGWWLEKNLRKKDCENVYILWRVAHLYPAITSSCRPDQNFFVGIRRVLKTGLYLIILNFLVTLSFSFYFISVLGHMVNFLIYTFEIENARNDIERNQLLMRMRFLCDRFEKSVVKLEQSRLFSIRRRFNMINMINHTFQ